MKSVLIVILLLTIKIMNAQNLVPNPSFESYTYCPGSVGDVMALDSWTNFGGTPDYYNICANGTATDVGVPSNIAGYQNPFDGNAYVGIILFAVNGSPNREYLGVTLSQTLNIGTKYFISAHISRADSSGSFTGSVCACNKFGFRFSTSAFSYTNPTPTNNSAVFSSSLVVNDTLGWTKISSSFLADSAYRYLAFGNFYNDANTSTLHCIYPQSLAYYYVDKICLSTDSLQCNFLTGTKHYDSNDQFRIFPNPAENYLQIENLRNGEPFEMSIKTGDGRELLFKTSQSSNEKIDVDFLDRGVYFLLFKTKNGTFNYKFLKK